MFYLYMYAKYIDFLFQIKWKKKKEEKRKKRSYIPTVFLLFYFYFLFSLNLLVILIYFSVCLILESYITHKTKYIIFIRNIKASQCSLVQLVEKIKYIYGIWFSLQVVEMLQIVRFYDCFLNLIELIWRQFEFCKP